MFRRKPIRASRAFRPACSQIESLEDRRLMALITIPVTTLADDPSGSIQGQVTLRDAINLSNAASVLDQTDVILPKGILTVSAPLPTINNDLQISGQSEDNTTIAATAPGFSGVYVNPGAEVLLQSLALSGFSGAGSGGDLINLGTTTVAYCKVLNGNATQGGGIYNDGNLTLFSSNIMDNTASGQGGGLYNSSAGLTTSTNAGYYSNSANVGGGVYNDGIFHGTYDAFAGNLVTPNTQGAAVYSAAVFTENYGIFYFNGGTQTADYGLSAIYNNGSVGGGMKLSSPLIDFNYTTGVYNGPNGTLVIVSNNDQPSQVFQNVGDGVINYGSAFIGNTFIEMNDGNGVSTFLGSSTTVNDSTLALNYGSGIDAKDTLTANADTSESNYGYGIWVEQGVTATVNGVLLTLNIQGGLNNYGVMTDSGINSFDNGLYGDTAWDIFNFGTMSTTYPDGSNPNVINILH